MRNLFHYSQLTFIMEILCTCTCMKWLFPTDFAGPQWAGKTVHATYLAKRFDKGKVIPIQCCAVAESLKEAYVKSGIMVPVELDEQQSDENKIFKYIHTMAKAIITRPSDRHVLIIDDVNALVIKNGEMEVCDFLVKLCQKVTDCPQLKLIITFTTRFNDQLSSLQSVSNLMVEYIAGYTEGDITAYLKKSGLKNPCLDDMYETFDGKKKNLREALGNNTYYWAHFVQHFKKHGRRGVSFTFTVESEIYRNAT